MLAGSTARDHDSARFHKLAGELAALLRLSGSKNAASLGEAARSALLVPDTQPPTVHNLPGRLDATTPASLPTDGVQELPDTGLRSSVCVRPIEHLYNPR